MTEPAAEEPVTCVCGRSLQDPVSVARGIGPVCWRKLHSPPARRPRTRSPAAQAGPGQTELPCTDQLDLWTST